MSEKMFGELMAVVGIANETNRLANGYRVPIDSAFQSNGLTDKRQKNSTTTIPVAGSNTRRRRA